MSDVYEGRLAVEDDEEEEEARLDNRAHLVLNEISGQSVQFDKEDLTYIESDARWPDLGVEKKLEERLLQLGFKKPSKIQNEVIRISKSNDVVAQAQSGSGKTLSYLIPAITRAIAQAPKPTEGKIAAPRAVIIADTNALIQQIAKIARSITSGIYDLVVDELFAGKREVDPQCAILVSTLAQIRNSRMRKVLTWDNLVTFIVDEADHVLEQDIARSFLPLLFGQTAVDGRVRFLFASATMTEAFRESVKSLQEKRSVVVIEKETQELTLKNVVQYAIRYTTPQQKQEFLCAIMQQLNAQNILIFDNSKRDLVQTTHHLRQLDYKAELVCKTEGVDLALNAADIQRKIDDFLAGKYRIMLTTNLLSRGIDMRKVTLVVNFSLPFRFVGTGPDRRKVADVETYLHRVGRTGRFGDHGIALNFVNSAEEEQMLAAIKNHYKNEVKEINLSEVHLLDKQLREIDEANRKTREYIESNI